MDLGSMDLPGAGKSECGAGDAGLALSPGEKHVEEMQTKLAAIHK